MKTELLHKYFRGETTEKEESQIVEWTESSAENKERFLKERMLFDITLFSDDSKIQRKRKLQKKERRKNKFKINCSFNRKGGLSGASRIIRFFLCGIFNFDYFFYTFVAILRCRVGGGLSHKD